MKKAPILTSTKSDCGSLLTFNSYTSHPPTTWKSKERSLCQVIGQSQTILGFLSWKKTSNSSIMEDSLNIFKNGRLHQFFSKWKTTSFFLNGRQPPFFTKMEEDLNYFSKMEDDLNFFQKCKTTSIFSKDKTNQIFWEMVDDLKARILDFAKP